jgi:hypothetical protein
MVGKWRRRFLSQWVEGLRDEPRPGASRTIDDNRIEAVITRTLESQPNGVTHWSSRGMARGSDLSVSTVQRIWRAFGAETAPPGDVQAVHRSGFRRQGVRRRRAVYGTTRARLGAMRG